MNTGLNLKYETIKLLDDNLGENLEKLQYSDTLYNTKDIIYQRNNEKAGLNYN